MGDTAERQITPKFIAKRDIRHLVAHDLGTKCAFLGHVDINSIQDLTRFVANPSFPCVMAKAAFSKGRVVNYALEGNSPEALALRSHEYLIEFVKNFQTNTTVLSSISFSFPGFESGSFGEFENFFWDFLKALDGEDKKTFQPDPRVKSDPNSPDFSFSVAGEAFFIIMLHPQSPRFARQFQQPTVVFNAHSQFEDLRRNGIFTKIRDLIRKRDKALQGNINPMLNDHGTRSEVFQYTGREYSAESRCPFLRAKKWFKFKGVRSTTGK